jgi:molybdopterin/thiamine biosynthesis adenylyltransferase
LEVNSLKVFRVGGLGPDADPFDRQGLIPWWDQERVRRARVMVAGAGAVGNETLKNLALLGFTHIFVVDCDLVSGSNLGRSVLFRRGDVGKKKAQVAAARTRALSPTEGPRVEWFHGDLVWELGTGVFRAMDVVLGCLDNAETRFAVNRQCWLAGTPWIDAGIYELAGGVSVFLPGRPPCYECGAAREQVTAARIRYSCDGYRRSSGEQGRVPTTQVAAALAAAIQVQEAVKLVCGRPAAAGKKVYFHGGADEYGLLKHTANPACRAHASYPEVVGTEMRGETRLGDFLEFVSRPEHSGLGAALDFRGDRVFVVSAPCSHCGSQVELLRPKFMIFEGDVVCRVCRRGAGARAGKSLRPPWTEIAPSVFSLEATGRAILDLPLRRLGVPPLHVLAVYGRGGSYRYYELSGDARTLFPTWDGAGADGRRVRGRRGAKTN